MRDSCVTPEVQFFLRCAARTMSFRISASRARLQPHEHTSRAYLTRIPHAHTSRAYLTRTPHAHTSRAHLTRTPHAHTSHTHLTRTPHTSREDELLLKQDPGSHPCTGTHINQVTRGRVIRFVRGWFDASAYGYRLSCQCVCGRIGRW